MTSKFVDLSFFLSSRNSIENQLKFFNKEISIKQIDENEVEFLGKFIISNNRVNIATIAFNFETHNIICSCSRCGKEVSSLNANLKSFVMCEHIQALAYLIDDTMKSNLNHSHFEDIVFNWNLYVKNNGKDEVINCKECIGLAFNYKNMFDYFVSYRQHNFKDYYALINKEEYFKDDKLKAFKYLTINEFNSLVNSEPNWYSKAMESFDYSSGIFKANKYVFKNFEYHKEREFIINGFNPSIFLPVNISLQGYGFGHLNDMKESRTFSVEDNSIYANFKDGKTLITVLNKNEFSRIAELKKFENQDVSTLITFSKYITFFYENHFDHYLRNYSSIPSLEYFIDIKNSNWMYQIYISDIDEGKRIGIKVVFKIMQDEYVISNFDNFNWILSIDPKIFYEIKEIMSIVDSVEENQFVINEITSEKLQELEELIKIVRRMKKVEIFVDSKYAINTQKRKINFNVIFNESICKLEFKLDDLTQEEILELLSKYKQKDNLVKLGKNKILNLNNYDIKDVITELDKIGCDVDDVVKNNSIVNRGLLFFLNSNTDNKEIANYINKINNYQHNKKIPENIQSVLKPHQVEGVNWIIKMFDNSFGCLLADEMGVGKTLQATTILSIYHNLNPNEQSIIVCPLSLVYNWKSEIEKYVPNIKAVEVLGSKEARKKIINDKSNNVLIVSYSTLIRDSELYADKNFLLSIIDETQFIKNTNSLNSKSVKMINSKYRLALTGTPIENNILELWSIFDYIVPGLLGTKKTFIKRATDSATSNEIIKKIISPFYLRREKKEVLKFLPDKVVKIISTEFTEEEQKEYENIKNEAVSYLLAKEKEMTTFQKQTYMFSTMTKLRMFCCNSSLANTTTHASSKLDMCMNLVNEILEKDEENKIIIFSQFTSLLDIIGQELHKKGIPFELLTGKNSTKERQDSIKNFSNNKDVKVFLISLKAGGVGLNITAANNVIHYDPWWNLAAENQATDRSHRLGQKRVVNVFKLIVSNTIEEKIIELQNKKMDLFNDIFEEEGSKKIDYDLMKEIINFNN